MSVDTISDVGGTTITLCVNGARLTMDLRTAQQIINQLAHQLDELEMDRAAAANRAKVQGAYRDTH
jgi:hypothetical protein